MMLTLDEAQAQLLTMLPALTVVEAALTAAAGRYAAADIFAKRAQPPFPASAMDGYAVRWSDMPGPWQIVGEAAAGRRFSAAVAAGEAVRIFTGAPLPAGADTVIVQEDVDRHGMTLRLACAGPARQGAHVRPAGLDFRSGERLVAAGERITPARLGLIAAGGHATIPVRRRPHVVLLATGDELVPAGAEPGPDQITSSNGPMLAALLHHAGAEVTDAGIVPDDASALDAALSAAQGADLLVTIGGASVGDHDLVLPALKRRSATIDFWKVAIKPGKPILTGKLGATRVIGLPGNPVSAFVCAHLFVLPAVRALLGAARPLPAVSSARTTMALPHNGPRRDHLRAVLGQSPDGITVTPAPVQDSSMLRTLAAADALIVRPEHALALAAGALVPVLPLDSNRWDS